MAFVELIELRLTELAAKPELVLAFDPRELIGDVASDVIATLWRGETHRIKCGAFNRSSAARTATVANSDVWCVAVWSARDETQALNVKIRVEICEDLIEVVDSYQYLI